MQMSGAPVGEDTGTTVVTGPNRGAAGRTSRAPTMAWMSVSAVDSVDTKECI